VEAIPTDSHLENRGAVNNGASEIEIRETLLQTSVYCGIPTGMDSFRVAEQALSKLKEDGLL
jgi:4-carboxymuconolactone decarboxylase